MGYLHNPTYNKQYFGMEHLQKRKDDDPARQTHGDGAAEPEESLAIEARCLVDWEYSNLQKNAEKAQLSAQFKDLIDL